MSYFNDQGHLTNKALQALCQEDEMDVLSRLELAEHLSFCDHCLAAYTELLSDQRLAPSNPKRAERLWRSIRLHALRGTANRFATAAAAIAIVLALWGFGIFGGLVSASDVFSSNEQTFLDTMMQYCETFSNQAGNAFEQLNNTIWAADQAGKQFNPIGGNQS